MTAGHVEILREVLALPVAPFHEEATADYVGRFAMKRGLGFGRDRSGNVVLRYRRSGGRGRAPLRWVFAAHMDHPGFVAVRRRGRLLWARFFGTVGREYFPGARARFFAPNGEVGGVVLGARKVPGINAMNVRLRLDRLADVPGGTIGMWDFPASSVRGRTLSARGCDDAVGAASVLCAMDNLARRRVRADVTGLLTRAEEVGLVGALAACRDRTIPRTALVVAIETSAVQPQAPLGAGVVIRVGDRARTFDPSLTAHLTSVAEQIRKRERNFIFTRQLMPGGTCESTAYACWGYRAAALCIPLANYHNRGPDRRITPERIDLGDFASLVRLLAGLAESRQTPEDTDRILRIALENLLRRQGPLL